MSALSTVRIGAVVRRHAHVLWRSPHRWFDIAFWPLMDVILWGSLGTFVARQDGSSQATTPYLLAGILLFHVIYQVQIALATGVMEETWSRNLLNVLTTPVSEVEYLLGVASFGLLKLVMALVTLSLTAFGFFGFGLGEVGWAIVPIVGVLIVNGWALSLVVIGLILRYGQSAEILAWGLNFVILAVSGVFNPVDALPGPLQPLARLLPTTEAFIAVREVLGGEAVPWDRVLRSALGTVVVVLLAMAFAVKMLRTFRSRGYVTRYS